MVVLVSTCR